MADRSAPRFYLSVQAPGAPFITIGDEHRVLSFRFEDDEQKTDKLTLTVDNYDLSALEGDLWVPENIIEFQFGYPGAMSPPRQAVIVKVSGFNPMTVEADSKDCLMNRIQRTDKHWEKVKRSDVVREIAKSYGYDDAQLSKIVDTKLIVDHITQGRMTDLQLIKSLASREGFEFFVDFDGVHFHRRSTKDKPIKTLVYFTDRGAGNIISVAFEVDKRGKQAASAVELTHKDPETGEMTTVRADAQTTAEERPALSGNNTNAGTEAKTIESVEAESGAVRYEKTPAAKQGAQELKGVSSEKTVAAAQRQATGAFLKHQLQGATLTLTIVLDALAFAKCVMDVQGMGTKLSGNWYVKTATHDVVAGTTTLKMAREGLNNQGVPSPAGQKNDQSGPPTDEKDGATGLLLGVLRTVDPFGSERKQYVPKPRGDGT